MPIVYPDNPKRKTRLIQLGSDAQDYLQEALSDYNTLQQRLSQVNESIAQVYRDAGLTPPSVRKVDIFKEAGVADTMGADAAVDITEIVADIAGLIAQVKYLAPAATRALVASGAMAESTAERVLVEFTVPVIGRDISITAGDVAGNVLGGVVGGVLIAGLDLGIEAIEGAVVKGKLIDAISKIYPMRTSIKLSQLRSKTLLDSLTAIKTTLDALRGAGVPITDKLIKNLIKRDADPSIAQANAYSLSSVEKDLHAFDISRGAYTHDDPSN